jgi:hypothetical protein
MSVENVTTAGPPATDCQLATPAHLGRHGQTVNLPKPRRARCMLRALAITQG